MSVLSVVLSFYECTKCCWDTGIWRYSNFDVIFVQLFFLTEKHHLKAYIKADILHPFIRLCVKCAWISCVQDKPLSITFKLKPGSNFYPDVMISRNAPAPEVDYLVWPIVFKYDNGPLLLKGIVHCSQLKWNKYIHVFTNILAY